MRPKPSKPSEVEKLILKLGFALVRAGKGSHRYYRHPDGKRTEVSFHKGRDIPPGTLRSIISDIGILVDEFNRMV